MTHDQQAVREACHFALPTYNMRCHCCKGCIYKGRIEGVESRLEEHAADCSLRIVIEAALNTATRENDESESETKVRLRHLMARLGLSRDEAIGLLTEQGARRITELTHGQALAMVTALERRFASNTESEGA